ncbi:unnamed protein product, partial [Staurois parvus]
MTHSGPGSSKRGGGTGAHDRLRAWQQHEESVRGPAPYHKMEPTNSVRRPESGTWQSVAMKSAAMEAVQGPMTHSGPGSSK